MLKYFRSHGLDCAQKIYCGGMNKDSEALIFLVLFLSRKKELELAAQEARKLVGNAIFINFNINGMLYAELVWAG